jgi:hypothetical protein
MVTPTNAILDENADHQGEGIPKNTTTSVAARKSRRLVGIGVLLATTMPARTATNRLALDQNLDRLCLPGHASTWVTVRLPTGGHGPDRKMRPDTGRSGCRRHGHEVEQRLSGHRIS